MADSRRGQILAILGSCTSALGVVRDGHRLGMRCHVFDRRRGVAFSSRLATSQVLESQQQQQWLESLESLGKSRPDSCLIATSDSWLRFLMANRERLAQAFPNILNPDNATLATCLNKLAFANWCERENIPSPAAAESQVDLPTRLRFPILLRPIETRHESFESESFDSESFDAVVPKAVQINSPAELAATIAVFERAKAKPLATESLLGKPLTSLSVPFVRRGDTMVSYVAQKVRPLPERCSVGTFFESCDEPEAEAIARRAIEALDYQGIGEVEILRNEALGEHFVIEINPRPWTQYAMASTLGLSFLGILLGDSPQPPRRRRAVWLEFTSDLYAVFSRREGMLSRGELTRWQYLRSLWRANSYAKFSWRDPLPFFADLKGTLGGCLRKKN